MFFLLNLTSHSRQEGKLPNDLLVARRLDARRHYVQNNLAYDPVFESLGATGGR